MILLERCRQVCLPRTPPFKNRHDTQTCPNSVKSVSSMARGAIPGKTSPTLLLNSIRTNCVQSGPAIVPGRSRSGAARDVFEIVLSISRLNDIQLC